MPIPKKLTKFLQDHKIKYETIFHRTVYTAYDKIATLKEKPNLVGKTLILKINGDSAVVLLPGNKNLDKNKFKKLINDWRRKQKQNLIKNIDFISERLIKNKFKGVKVGAVPPFGSLWKLPTFADKNILKEQKIIINGGDYNCSIKIKSIDFKKLIQDLIIGNFGKSKK